jgi:hypothetical protein
MVRAILVCASIVTFAAAAAPALAGGQKDDCASSIEKLDNSTAEGEERLAEKYKVINFCDGQYAHDSTIKALVKECAKYAAQPVVKQQFLAECQLAAFKYANALRDLKAEYRSDR